MKLKETLLQSKTLFEGKIISLLLDTVRLPNGKETSREVIRHNGAACILAITSENKVILVKQFRHPTGAILLEIPAGKLDKIDENPKEAALRELAEETPYTAKSATLLHSFYSAPGFCDEKLHLFLAHNVVKNSQLTADKDEFIQEILMTKEEVTFALKNQQIQDAKTLIALQTWLLQP